MTTLTLDKKKRGFYSEMSKSLNHIQEEHKIRVYSNYPIRDSFTGLWKTIAKCQHFFRLVIPHSSTGTASTPSTTSAYPTKQQIDQAIQEQGRTQSPYSSRIFEDYQVIYQKKDVVIVTNTTPFSALGTFFAVEDSDFSNRYFVAFAFPVGAETESLTGLFVYFKENNNCFSCLTVISERVLATYDVRNGLIRAPQVFLYHQTLALVQLHRDTNKLLLYLSYVPYQTDAIEYQTSYYMSYSVNRHSPISLIKRFLHVPLVNPLVNPMVNPIAHNGGDETSNLLFDLGSLHHVEEKHLYHPITPGSVMEYQVHHYLALSSYHVTKNGQIMSFLEMAQSFPEREYSDGYPIHCAQCLQKVTSATYGYKPNLYSSIHTGLGSGYCPHCQIRYSLSKGEWVCAKIRVDGDLCGGFLYQDWACRNTTLHSQDQSVVQLSEGCLPKYPYREQIRLQWIPTESARLCAETAHGMIGADFYATDTPPLKVDDKI
jgi:hypothetical protein